MNQLSGSLSERSVSFPRVSFEKIIAKTCRVASDNLSRVAAVPNHKAAWPQALQSDGAEKVFYFEARRNVREGRPDAKRAFVDGIECGQSARVKFPEDHSLR